MALFDDMMDELLNRDRNKLADEAQNRAALNAPLGQGDEDSLLSKLGGKALSGLSWVGQTIGKPGRAARGLLAGQPGELANLLPFSDTLGITDPDKSVSGDDLLDKWGLRDKSRDKPEGFFETVADAAPGFAAEVATDPLSYLTFGGSATNQAGKLAQKIGALPKNAAGRIRGFSSVEDIGKLMGRSVPEATAQAAKVGVDVNSLLNQPLGGLANVRVPFVGDVATLGTGDAARHLAEFGEKVGGKLAYSGPGRYLSSMFDPTVEGKTTEVEQRLLRANEPYYRNAQSDARRALANVFEPIAPYPELTQRFGKLRDVVENAHGASMIPYAPEVMDAANEAATRYRNLDSGMLSQLQSRGVDISQLTSDYDLEHAFRGRTPLPNAAGLTRGGRREYATTPGSAIQREPFLDLPGGTNQVESLVRDPSLAGWNRSPTDVLGNPIPELLASDPRGQGIRNNIVQAFGQFSPSDFSRYQQLRTGAKAGGLTAQEAAELQQLSVGYKGSNQQIQKSLRTDLLGLQPGEIQGVRTGRAFNAVTKSRLRQLEESLDAYSSGTGPALQAGELDNLKRLRDLNDESKYLTRRLYQARREGQLYKNPGDEILPFLNTARRDRAAERMVRERLGATPEAIAELESKIPHVSITGGLPAGGAFMTPQQQADYVKLTGLSDKAPQLSRWLGGLDPQRVGPNGVGVFGNDLLSDLATSQRMGLSSLKNADLVQGLLQSKPSYTRLPEQGAVKASELLRDVGLTGGNVGGRNNGAAAQELLNALNAKGVFGNQQGKIGDLKNVFVPRDIADAVRAYVPKTSTPGYLDPAIEGWDSLTKLFRTLNTAPFPNTQVRNATSDLANNILSGLSPAEALGGAKDFAKLRNGPGASIEGLAASAKGLGATTDQEAAKLLGQEYYAQGLAGVTPAREAIEAGHSGLGDLIPGAARQPSLTDELLNYLQAGKPWEGQGTTWQNLKSNLNPANVEGFNGRNVTGNTLVKAGRGLGESLYETQQGGHFLSRLRQGYTPEAAAQEVKNAFGDYRLTDFEKTYLKRLFPFYSWTQANTPLQVGRLLEQPGGLTAQAIRASNDLHQKEGFLPEYLGGGLAVPVGGEDNGTQRYLTSTGLPYEDALDMASFGPKGLEKTLMHQLSQLNPLIKGPLEVASNRQFYSGRDLDQLYSRTGIPFADQLLYNSPAAKATGIAGQIIDPRKDTSALLTNLLTGARLSDVDMARQRDLSAKDLVNELLTGDQNIGRYEKLYIRPDQLGNVSPEEIDLMRLYKAVEKRAEQRAKQAHPLP